MRLILPANQQMHNGFRPYGDPRGRHSGQDYGWASGDDIKAAAPGRVIYVRGDGNHNQGWGNRIIIEHAPGVRTTYNHLATGTINVSLGQTVGAGHYLGKMGTTGTVTAKHLHFELYLNGERVDPAPYFGRPLPGTAIPAVAGSAAHQRQVRPDLAKAINGRTEAKLSAHIDQHLQPGDVGDFKGFVRGESVTQNGVTSNIWYVGAYRGNHFWAGNFTTQSTDGLQEYGGPVAQTALYVRIPEPWFVHTSEAAARGAQKGHQGPTIPAGDYRVIRGSGPYEIETGSGPRWIGTGRTNPPTVRK